MSPPILWVPGHLCDARLYAPQLEALGGRVAEVTHADSIAEMASRLLAGAPARFVVAGLSMGGMVAMETMAREPGRIAGAVLMDTDPCAARERERAWRAREMAGLRAEGPEGYVSRFTAKFFAHDAGTEALFGPKVRAMAAAMPAEVIEAQARALDAREDMLERIAGFGAPVEVIVGEADRVCPPRLHWPIAAACRDALLTHIPDCGHIATLEAPVEIEERVAALLARLA
jgi:pimeloyl-ACP methyl ester carboxylesterase